MQSCGFGSGKPGDALASVSSFPLDVSLTPADLGAHPHSAQTLTTCHSPYNLPAEEGDLRIAANYLSIQNVFITLET